MQIASGQGLGRKQKMFGRARGKASEIDSTVTADEPNRQLQWHHDAEFLDGRRAPVVYAADAQSPNHPSRRNGRAGATAPGSRRGPLTNRCRGSAQIVRRRRLND